jgi:hypothetical protein
LGSLGILLYRRGKSGEAEPLYRETLAATRATLGSQHINTIHSTHNLAGLLRDMGKLDDAEPLFREALAGRWALLGRSHPDTRAAYKEFLKFLTKQNKALKAKELRAQYGDCM